MHQKRQLAAIMFTDIEGYTSLMQQDESIAIDFRDKHRYIFENNTLAFNGKIVQYFGDGTLSVFKSSVEAVECAIKMQLAFIAENIPVRIGIHIGDIVYTKDDIVGDAVNVASRIESSAVAGSILISDKVHDQIRSHRHIESKFLDAYEFKNIESAIPLFSISNIGLTIPDAKEVKGKLKEGRRTEKITKTGRKRSVFFGLILGIVVMSLVYYKFFPTIDRPSEFSIAVLPFKNLSTDQDSEIFRDGITEDLLTQLSKLKDLHVISRTSMSKYKNTEKTIPQIADELGVTLILEGSIRKYGDQVRVNAQLINAENDERIWGEEYDKTLVDIFAIQTEVSKEIVNALELNLSFEEQQNLVYIPTKNIEAYKLFLKGRQEADKRNSESLARSIILYNQALLIDPNYAEALAEIANSIYLETYYSNRDPVEASKTANEYLNRAEAISDKVSRIYSVRGLILNIEGRKDEAKLAFEKAIELSPNDLTSRHQYSTYYFYIQDYENQLKQAEIAYRLDPLSFPTANTYFTALVENYKFDEAEHLMKELEKKNDSNNQFVIDRSFFRLYLAKREYQKAIPWLEKLAAKEYSFSRFLGYCYGITGDNDEARNIIKKIEALKIDIKEEKNYLLAVVYAGIEDKEKVFYYLDTIRNSRSGLLQRELNVFFNFMKNDPRFPNLMQTHGIENW